MNAEEFQLHLKKRKLRRYPAKPSWQEIDGKRIYFRSNSELKYARYLTLLKENKTILDWFYEPETFWFESIRRGTRSYVPDFKIINNDNTHEWVEVKGYMDQRSRTKISRFRKYYPNEKLTVVPTDWFDKNRNLFKCLEGYYGT